MNVSTRWRELWKRKRATQKHLILAFSLVLGLYVLYTVFKAILPSPDVLSPFAYLIAFSASLIAYIRLEDRQNARIPLFVLILCGLAFLDEISYGVEPGFVNPIYVEKYNVYIYDLHNLIGLSIELIQIFLEENNWNTALFSKFMQIDLLAILLSAAYIIVLRSRQKENRLKEQILFQLTIFLLITGLFSILSLALLPADPKNAWLFGYSRSRVAIMAGILLLSSFPIVLIGYFKRVSNAKQLSGSRIQEVLNSQSSLQRLRALALAAIVAGLIYEFWTPFITYPDQKVIVDRITPIVTWALFSSVLLLSAIQAWKGKVTRSMKSYVDPIREFFEDNPALIYATTAVLIIIVAQVNDKGWVLLGNYFTVPSIRITDLGWWTEEVFEFTAAIEFYAASLFYKKAA